MIRPLIPCVPDAPTSKIDDLRQLRTLEHDPGVVPPGPAEVVRSGAHIVARGGADARLVDDVPAAVFRRPPGCRHPAFLGGDDADGALLEPGLGALAEDEVCRAFDVGLCVELGAFLREQGVLVACEGAGIVALLLCRV